MKLKPIEKLPTLEEKIDYRYCLYRGKVGHPKPDCYTVRKIDHNKVKRGKIVQATKNNPLPNYKLVLTCTIILNL